VLGCVQDTETQDFEAVSLIPASICTPPMEFGASFQPAQFTDEQYATGEYVAECEIP